MVRKKKKETREEFYKRMYDKSSAMVDKALRDLYVYSQGMEITAKKIKEWAEADSLTEEMRVEMIKTAEVMSEVADVYISRVNALAGK